MNGRVFGGKCSELLANYNLGSLSWRTSQRSLFGGYQKFSGRWPRTGMMQSGQLFLLLNVERRTEETESLLLPTPCAAQIQSPERRQRAIELAQQNLPLYTRRTVEGKKIPNARNFSVLDALVYYSNLPTPTKTDVDKHSTGGLIRRLTYPEGQQVYSKGDHRNKSESNLTIGERPLLNPQFVEHMMGFPIGWTSLEHLETPSCPNAQNGSEEK